MDEDEGADEEGDEIARTKSSCDVVGCRRLFACMDPRKSLQLSVYSLGWGNHLI